MNSFEPKWSARFSYVRWDDRRCSSEWRHAKSRYSYRVRRVGRSRGTGCTKSPEAVDGIFAKVGRSASPPLGRQN